MSHPLDPGPTRTLDAAAGEVLIFADKRRACEAAAAHIAASIRSVNSTRGRTVLGLATGATPVLVYERLVAQHRAGLLSFRDVTTYNLDEYYPIGPLDTNSYRSYMHNHLFAQVDLSANRAHVLDGTVPEAFVGEHCDAYERWIEADGGLDVQLLGIGRNGHIGFNEPSDLSVEQFRELRTRVVALHGVTLEDAARDFGGRVDNVPTRALTMGTATILRARSIVVLAFGKAKAESVAKALFGPVSSVVPASLLQTVRDRVLWLVDDQAIGPH